MDVTDIGYPHDHERFQREVHALTEAEIEVWLRNVPAEPAPGASEPYENFMQRQAYYTKYVNQMILARDEYAAQGDKLRTSAPPVGEDIKEVIEWVQRTGDTPIEYLVRTYRSSSSKTQDRISAARAVLDYVHRKMPQTIDVKDDRKSKETEESQLQLLRRVEELLSESIQSKKQLQRVK
jgi:hypothetical protein